MARSLAAARAPLTSETTRRARARAHPSPCAEHTPRAAPTSGHARGRLRNASGAKLKRSQRALSASIHGRAGPWPARDFSRWSRRRVASRVDRRKLSPLAQLPTLLHARVLRLRRVQSSPNASEVRLTCFKRAATARGTIRLLLFARSRSRGPRWAGWRCCAVVHESTLAASRLRGGDNPCG